MLKKYDTFEPRDFVMFTSVVDETLGVDIDQVLFFELSQKYIEKVIIFDEESQLIYLISLETINKIGTRWVDKEVPCIKIPVSYFVKFSFEDFDLRL